MAILPPKLFDPSELQEENTSLSKVWKISVPSTNSLYWSIILSYVIYADENGLWQRGYELLLGTESQIENVMKKKKISRKPDKKMVKEHVLRFNPFRHRHSIYFNDYMSDVLRIFKPRLNSFAGNIVKRIRILKREEQWDNSFKLKAASEMLECQIVVITECSGTTQVVSHDARPKTGGANIVIFQEKDVQKGERVIDVFSFGMSIEHSISLRRDALGFFLKRAQMDLNDVLQIQNHFQYDGSFLLYLLTSEWKRIVPLIYESPYIASKLQDAGFTTDPCCIGQNGKTSFFPCMGFESSRILQILYNYAVNNFQQSVESTRNPNDVILECLKKVGRCIKKDCENSDNYSLLGERQVTALKSSRDMLVFNEYQSCVVEEIWNILQSSCQKTQKRKKIVISVLDNYLNFKPQEVSSFENHVEFSAYFESIDNYTCLMFFDKVLSLNPVTVSDNFANTVLNLILTVLSYKMFPKCKHGAHCLKCQVTVDDCALRFISYNHREKFEEAAKMYMGELKNDADGTDEDSNVMSKNIRMSLKDFSEITDEFLVKRVEIYLKTATRVSLDIDLIKGILTIERAMQVIGETLHIAPNSKSVIGHLLNACLPNDIAHELSVIRNRLSHYRPNIMQGRIQLENNKIKYKSLQNLLANLDEMLEPVYISQEFRVEECLIKINEMESRKLSENIFQNIKIKREALEALLKDKFVKNKKKYKLLSNKVLDYIEKLIESSKVKKENELYSAVDSLNFLFSLIAKQCDINKSQEILKYVQELVNLVPKTVEIKDQLKEEILRNISHQRTVLLDAFNEDKPEKVCTLSNFAELHKYLEDITSDEWFTVEEMCDIQKKVFTYLEKSNKYKQDLEEQITNNQSYTIDEIKEQLTYIFTSFKNKELIATKFQTNPKNALKILKTIKNIDVFKNVQELIVFSEREEGRNVLLSIQLPGDLEKKLFRFLSRNLQCILNRIAHLKEILIDDDEEINMFWKWGKSNEIKKHSRFLMGQRYMKERDVRASLEMLLFDCMNILIDRKDLEHLWTKTTNLFSGICLRDVLSHGSTVLETVGGMLDPEDLPSQFIDKILELVEDGEALIALSNFYEKTKPVDIKHLEKLVIAGSENKKSLEGRILKCTRWKDYLPLLPLR